MPTGIDVCKQHSALVQLKPGSHRVACADSVNMLSSWRHIEQVGLQKVHHQWTKWSAVQKLDDATSAERRCDRVMLHPALKGGVMSNVLVYAAVISQRLQSY